MESWEHDSLCEQGLESQTVSSTPCLLGMYIRIWTYSYLKKKNLSYQEFWARWPLIDFPHSLWFETQDFYKFAFGTPLTECFQSDFCLTDHCFQNYHSIKVSPNESVMFGHGSSQPCLTLQQWCSKLCGVYENPKIYF